MYGYSKDIAIKNSPEDFVYYTPRGLNYTTTYINYTVNKDYRITRESKPQNGSYFYHYKDGSSGAYCTFMGSDMKITQVRTGNKNGRRLMIIKDSYGNAVPGYMFYSFEEVHVVDFRYFNKNMRKYVRDHGITDIALVVNIYNAYSPRTAEKLMHYLGQSDNAFAPATPSAPTSTETARKPEAAKPAAAKPAAPKPDQPSKPSAPKQREEKAPEPPAEPAAPAEPSTPA